ncbi:hypothetical protein JTB14_036054 [Gonioctena quinquepunctata]|nr:hypothetical protein JTB14_036054 [Gonioctena quinquepunctata]
MNGCKQNRRSANGCSLPSWLLPSTKVLMKNLIELEDGRETTVSLRHLAPNSEGGTQLESRSISNDEANTIQDQSKDIPEGEKSGTGNPKLSTDKDSLVPEESLLRPISGISIDFSVQQL